MSLTRLPGPVRSSAGNLLLLDKWYLPPFPSLSLCSQASFSRSLRNNVLLLEFTHDTMSNYRTDAACCAGPRHHEPLRGHKSASGTRQQPSTTNTPRRVSRWCRRRWFARCHLNSHIHRLAHRRAPLGPWLLARQHPYLRRQCRPAGWHSQLQHSRGC